MGPSTADHSGGRWRDAQVVRESVPRQVLRRGPSRAQYFVPLGDALTQPGIK
ncbi:hypothetical protein [Streptomyces sp. NPDC056192]|uniref:hypothetical protein n=1 Tax=unclassified Streptomyces TaxID=2593676 RepID=UPI0035DD8885